MTTLCYIEKDDSYLMMHRTVKKNDVNKDKWIGVGGHAELGESPEECLLREVKEETGYTLTSWRFRGLVTFVTEAENSKTVEYMEYMCLYTADGFTGEPTACDEGELAWVKKEDVLHLNLWEGDKIFFRLLNEDEPFFSLKLRYVGDTLAEAVLNGKQMELFEERSGDGTPTGTIVERGVAHSEGRCHGTAHIWIARANEKSGCEVLLQKRSAWKDSLYRSRFGKGGKIMKKLEIVIRPESLENLELLLEEQKANGMMITNILGYGNQKGYRQMYRGAEIVAKMLPKVKVETVVEDDKVPKIVDFVVKNLSTGNYGDGKIFVYDVEDAVRIRTGEHGEQAL